MSENSKKKQLQKSERIGINTMVWSFIAIIFTVVIEVIWGDLKQLFKVFTEFNNWSYIIIIIFILIAIVGNFILKITTVKDLWKMNSESNWICRILKLLNSPYFVAMFFDLYTVIYLIGFYILVISGNEIDNSNTITSIGFTIFFVLFLYEIIFTCIIVLWKIFNTITKNINDNFREESEKFNVYLALITTIATLIAIFK